MKWQFDNNRPLYIQIVQVLKADILAGVYPVSSKFPTVRELAVEASVNPNTMMKALQLLEAEGFVQSHRTAGRVVTDDLSQLHCKKKDSTKEIMGTFLENMRQLGYGTEEILELVKEELKHGTG